MDLYGTNIDFAGYHVIRFASLIRDTCHMMRDMLELSQSDKMCVRKVQKHIYYSRAALIADYICIDVYHIQYTCICIYIYDMYIMVHDFPAEAKVKSTHLFWQNAQMAMAPTWPSQQRAVMEFLRPPEIFLGAPGNPSESFWIHIHMIVICIYIIYIYI